MNQIISKKEYTENVFNQYYAEILNYVMSRIGHNTDISQDIAQEIFIKAWDNRFKYNVKKGSIRTWIYTIARNHLVDYYRSRRYEYNSFENEAICIAKFEVDVEDREMFGFVMKKLAALKENERELIYLRYVQELTIKEVSTILRRSKIATKVAIHRAIKKLRQIIDE